MTGHVSDSHLAKLSFTVSRPQIPFGWRYMVHDVIIWSAVRFSAPHSQNAMEAMPHLCIDDRKMPTPIWRRFNQTQAGLESPIPSGRTSTSSKNECRREVLSCHPMLHLWYAHLAVLVSSLLASPCSFSAAGTKECLGLSCQCPP